MTGQITQYLRNVDPDDPQSYDALLRLVYDDLRRIAYQLRRTKHGGTLNATALVHESLLRLFASEPIDWQNHNHFYGVAVQAMKQIVIDHARARVRIKRGGGAPHISVDDATVFIPDEDAAFKLLELNDALDRYGQHDSRGKEIFEYIYFLGMTHQEVSREMDVSTKTVQRSQRSVEAWFKENYTAGA
ncbi:MAG: sigma-70 family RNA polymerase sigma factor [Rhodothermales bacterium]|nr:sigma-70 family RNA polymerase sigma factor [Rhodothermales bacterium]